MNKIKAKVCVRYQTVKGVEMFNQSFDITSSTATHVELFVWSTGERVVFARSEIL